MLAIRQPLLAALALGAFAMPSGARASGSGCSTQDRDALLVGAIARGVKHRAQSGAWSGRRCLAISIVSFDTIDEREPSDRVLARVRRLVRPHHVATRTDLVRQDAAGRSTEGCATWESLTVGEPRCRGIVASVQVEGEHCAPVFERVGRHWEGRPVPCE
jgi:hypothetical protein